MDDAEALELVSSSSHLWHQRFRLSSSVFSPGANDVDWLWKIAGIPEDLTGARVLDVGTTNGGFAFEAERRGAASVLAVDIVEPELFGFPAIRDALGSRVEFMRASLYELPELVQGTFDIVLCLGVLYHLRHPLLGLDAIHALTNGEAFVETAVCDAELGEHGHSGLVRFYRRGELHSDPSNWFAPTFETLKDWCASAGFDVVAGSAWPNGAPERGLVRLRPDSGLPEYRQLSYEVPLRVRAEL